MPNPPGTNLTTIAPVALSLNGDAAAGAGAWTTALSSQVGGVGVLVVFPGPLSVIPRLRGALVVVLGAAAPTALQLAYALVAGTPIATYTVEPGLLVALAELVIPFEFVGAQAAGLFAPAGKNPLVQVNPTAQAVTVKAVGSFGWFDLSLGVS